MNEMKSSVRSTPLTTRKRNRSKGQAISEYAMLLAFVAVLVALVFAFAPGRLTPAVSAAFSSMAEALNEMVDAAAAASFIQILDVDIVNR